MRTWCIPLALVLGGVAWFANASPTAQTQFSTAGLTQGEQVRVYIREQQGDYGFQCQVLNVSDGFLGCAVKRDGSSAVGQSPVESWHNLRYVARIERPAKR